MTSTSRLGRRRSRPRWWSARSSSASSKARPPMREQRDRPAEGGSLKARPQDLGQVRDSRRRRRGRDAALGQVLPTRARRPDRRLHLAWGGESRSTAMTVPTRRCCGATQSASPTSPGRGTARRASSSRSRSTPGPPQAARGSLARLLGGWRKHPRSALPVKSADGQEPVRRGGRRHAHAQERDFPAAPDRVGLRRLQGHPGCRLRAACFWGAAPRRPQSGAQEITFSARGTIE